MTTRVYIDVENTLSVPFVSGIQRVSRQLSRQVVGKTTGDFHFIPVVYCEHCRHWRRLTAAEADNLLQNSSAGHEQRTRNRWRERFKIMLPPMIRKIMGKLEKRIAHYRHHKALRIPRLGYGSIFLDLDASWHNPLNRAILLPELKSNGLFIATLHHDIIPVLFPQLIDEKTRPIFTEHLHAHIQYSDLIICNSNNSQKDLLDYCRTHTPGHTPKTGVIRLGTNTAVKGGASLSLPAAIHGKKYLLCVGTIEPRKNHGLLLDAFDQIIERFPDLCLVIVGRPGWQSQQTIDRIRDHTQYGHRLLWLHGLDDMTLEALYKHAWLTVIPSLYEGFGLPVIEALAYGCPVIASERGALTEAGGDYVEYFNPADRDAFIELLVSYLTTSRRESAVLRLKTFQAPDWPGSAHELIDLLEQNYGNWSNNPG